MADAPWDVLYIADDARSREVFGDLYNPAKPVFEYGVPMEVCRLKSESSDGQDVVITETRVPSRFFTLHVSALPDRVFPYVGVVPGKPALVIGTGSSAGELALTIARAITGAMLGIRLAPAPPVPLRESPDDIRAVVTVACPVCDGLTPISEGHDVGSFLVIACQHCARRFDVPRSSIHDAQNQCLVALGEA